MPSVNQEAYYNHIELYFSDALPQPWTLRKRRRYGPFLIVTGIGLASFDELRMTGPGRSRLSTGESFLVAVFAFLIPA